MNIDDILKQGPFKNEDDFTAEMSKTAGEKVLSRLDETFESREKGLAWLYTACPALGGERPYLLCKRGQDNLVIDELNRIDHGMHS